MFLQRRKWLIAPVALGVVGWAAVLFGSPHKPLTPEITALFVGLILFLGAGSGLLAALFGFMFYRLLFTAPPRFDLEPGESMVYTGVANHFLDGEGRGGRLHATERRLVFTPHRFNVQLQPWSVRWADVMGFSLHDSTVVKALAFVASVRESALQNFVIVQLRDGTTAKLVVNARQQVADDLEALRRAYGSSQEASSGSGSR